jgi:UDP:flavonoid glycosyltransferase YjiC (YdhE family)
VTTAGPSEGRGHAVRAIALGQALGAVGATVSMTFVRGGPTPNEASSLVDAGIAVTDDLARDRWGTTVVDLPDPNEASHLALNPGLVVFDDAERFQGRAAIIVQPSLPSWSGAGFAERVLAGYAWAPIGPAWRRSPIDERSDRTVPAEHEGRQRVLVCFGGSDPAAVTARIGAVVAADDRWTTTVVAGAGYAGPDLTGVDVVRDPADLPVRVAAADLVVLGAGTMKFEVAAAGRPALLLAVADDQLPVGPPFAATGAARWLGDGRTIDPDAVRRAVAALLADAPARHTMAATGRRVVDGHGAERLAAEIIALARQTPTARTMHGGDR